MTIDELFQDLIEKDDQKLERLIKKYKEDKSIKKVDLINNNGELIFDNDGFLLGYINEDYSTIGSKILGNPILDQYCRIIGYSFPHKIETPAFTGKDKSPLDYLKAIVKPVKSLEYHFFNIEPQIKKFELYFESLNNPD